VIAQINRQMFTYGFRADDLGDAYAAWWLNAWLAFRGRSDDPTPRQIAAVRAQAARAIGSLPQMFDAGDVAKQEMAEAYLVRTALIGAGIEQAKGDSAQLKRFGASRLAKIQAFRTLKHRRLGMQAPLAAVGMLPGMRPSLVRRAHRTGPRRVSGAHPVEFLTVTKALAIAKIEYMYG
jgi:hypothetical protein